MLASASRTDTQKGRKSTEKRSNTEAKILRAIISFYTLYTKIQTSKLLADSIFRSKQSPADWEHNLSQTHSDIGYPNGGDG